MLNGLYPVLLFYTVPVLKNGKTDFLPPLPVYLDESATKLALESESESLDIASETLAGVDGNNQVEIVQKGLTQSVTIELKAREDDAILGMILPVLKNIATDVIAAHEYKIAYFHRDILIFEAKLGGYEKRPESGTNLIRLSITIEVKPSEKKKKGDKQEPVPYSAAEPLSTKTTNAAGQTVNQVELIPTNDAAKAVADLENQKKALANMPKLVSRGDL